MREIKFRAWDNDHSGWHEFDVNDLKLDGKKILRLISSDGSFTIEQFTGLKDKSGVEIFEGDAITIPLHEHQLPYGLSVHVGDDLESKPVKPGDEDYWLYFRITHIHSGIGMDTGGCGYVCLSVQQIDPAQAAKEGA